MFQFLRILASLVPNAAVNKLILFFDLADLKLKTKNESGVVNTLVVEDVNTISSAKPYKLLSFLLSQAGTDNPTSTVYVNNVGTGITYTRDVLGTYFVTKAGAFLAGKVPKQQGVYFDSADSLKYYTIERVSDNVVSISTTDGSFVAVEALFNASYFEIKVYP